MYGLNGLYHYLCGIITPQILGGGKIVIEPEPELINSYRYYIIMKMIRNGVPLNDEELTSLKTLSKEQLIEIIEINNKNIDLFNKLIHFTEEKNKIKNKYLNISFV
jgi:hypothetical protein